MANLRKQFSCYPVLLQPQPASTDAPVVTSDAPVPPPAAMKVRPLVVAAPPPAPPVHQAHYDLRHTFTGVASVESASGETFLGKATTVVQPGVPVAAGPVVRPCPGRIRHFKI